MESPGSPLSEHSDDEFQDQDETYPSRRYLGGASPSPPDGVPTRPAKRQKTAHRDRDRDRDRDSIHLSGPLGNFDALPPPPHPDEDLSSDTDGSVPGSPHLAAAATIPGEEDDGFGHKGEQISFCRWEGCGAGELGNMDLLVQHLHDEHIHARQKKYSCEWADCTRKGIAHASGYALRAHMRSHTREKPFYCTLPECDRSFTRSDALAKHMRTVHETEALRPSDPVPKHHSSNPQNKHQKLRLTFKAIGNGTSNGSVGPGSDAGKSSVPASPMTGPTHAVLDEEWEHNNVVFVPASSIEGYQPSTTTTGGASEQMTRQFPPDVHFTEDELSLPPEKLLAVLKTQLQFATEESEILRREVDDLDEKRRKEWTAKELALENFMEAEAEGAARRKVVGGADEEALVTVLKNDTRQAEGFVLKGQPTPWWRLPRRVREDGGDAMEGVETAVEVAPGETVVV